jgi:phosphatidylglycerol:prolipoprotein diacylglycerol transferase
MYSTFINSWQHLPEHISPVLFHIGEFQVRYYGLMYIVAFTIVYLLVTYRIKHEKLSFSGETVQNYFIWAILGLMIGARLGYVIFYNIQYYISHPLEIFLPFSFNSGFHYTGIGGMSYHGGLIGIILGTLFYCSKYKINFWELSELFIPAIPLGYTFGRLGNFINGELYGRATDVPWGMYFPLDTSGQLRHPSQLYEAFFEGVFPFIVLWGIRKKSPFPGFLLSIYLIGYGTVRFFIEFVREPDPQLGFVLGPFTMGQILCFFMIIAGIAIIFITRHHERHLRRKL